MASDQLYVLSHQALSSRAARTARETFTKPPERSPSSQRCDWLAKRSGNRRSNALMPAQEPSSRQRGRLDPRWHCAPERSMHWYILPPFAHDDPGARVVPRSNCDGNFNVERAPSHQVGATCRISSVHQPPDEIYVYVSKDVGPSCFTNGATASQASMF